ncbi:MAG: single-stranded-DNA-specific exonuclease RecJ [Candidatus Marinimicrobia bacterium]|nr:single-stranded-DNA-specific exonuclease RecJ [Candidatus Neomarinimicrobiota bacterium]MBL7022899.1 single-stranded-DNA-specific exonuclease RecJ [Candidatus Neomarinimicrobiota bacterium]MBL7109218.1 single-stranded-DNA-specific exonuclease RecJ [Candidatus Neomarinimicrobiota bacterium]
MELIWKYKEVENNLVKQVAEEFQLPEVYARVMTLRGITDREKSRKFFYSGISKIHDPFLMKNMDTAVDKILNQIKQKKPILVFGDYDVDGTSGTAMLYLFLKSIGADTHFYIPDRITEGYGLSEKGIEFAELIGADLLVTCDCGINAVEMVEFANKKDIDVIITDHHVPDKILPSAYAILNPNQVDCDYPFKGLCGAGVAFKLALAITKKENLDPNLAWQHSDLIALGTAADIVPIVDENRIIVEQGIKLIQKCSKPGIKALLQTAGLLNKDITVGRLVFWMAPRINAAGRLGDAGRSVKLMATNNPVFARELASELEVENTRRQKITADVVDEAIYQVNSKHDVENEHAIILSNEHWHHGVVGIVASRIKELYYRPTIVISVDEDGIGTGSCRSIPSFNMYDALSECGDLLDGFGGHPIAAGLTIRKDNIPEFCERFGEISRSWISKDKLIPVIEIDAKLDIKTLDSRFINFLKTLAPYGPGNMRPKFLSKNVSIIGFPKLIGKESDTLKFQIRAGKNIIDVIGFKMGNHYEKLLVNTKVDLLYEIGENVWNGVRKVQLELKDIKLCGDFLDLEE